MKKAILTLTAVASLLSFNLSTSGVSAATVQKIEPTKIEASSTIYSSITMKVGEGRKIAGDRVYISSANPTYCLGLDAYGNLTAFAQGYGTVVAEWNSGTRVVYYVTVTP
ncbi:hypothetical protein [Paenibacillus mucilaginosus]|uniref:BIG2 domain-containing protein n=2 Tax=Paenibacillus mucilaginosus TaxID=61624 RepID=H6NKN2_9BACL|nr:hypothetical protein [Paenibacillus mucilaginosus]AEI45462.1 hypothetical protein KNP414_06950 [Paenibacillus mucilaginosus KNP414]AFC33169.1 hypothetical protein PM3016_6544 [Paenibacillus mucilaginosus 3016]MCG7215222.1 hypothetical protein [Paenibacillus mucilaginosus]WDM26891.1 hypothetical protein KCX80_31530 [Paenibacillus mucilaginosus]WFA21599.1 hypothetical protein ERY13_32540 [Paenibacillus mucilaginosus]